MKAILAVLFLASVAVYAMAEMEYHPQAIMHYLEMEDQEMARKVRGIIKLEDPQPFKPSFRPPSGFPTGIPPKIVSILNIRNALFASECIVAQIQRILNYASDIFFFCDFHAIRTTIREN